MSVSSTGVRVIVLVCAPFGTEIVRGSATKSSPEVAVENPPIAYKIVTAEPVPLTAPRSMVYSPVSSPLSEALSSVAEIVITPVSSLSIVTVAVSEISTAAKVPERLAMVMVRVSSSSTRVSAVGTTSKVWVSPKNPLKLTRSPLTWA